MKLLPYKETRTGLKVFKLEEATVPRIGQVIRVEDKRYKVLDVIGRVDTPFLLLKELPRTSTSKNRRRAGKARKSSEVRK